MARTPQELYYIIARVWLAEKQQTRKKPKFNLSKFAFELGLTHSEYDTIRYRASRSIREANIEERNKCAGFKRKFPQVYQPHSLAA